MAVQIQFRRDTAANWTSVNPILAQGEMGIETDTDQFKIGNGIDTWSVRPYGGITGATGPAGVSLVNIEEGVDIAAPNATVPNIFVKAVSGATNADVTMQPKGTGAFTLQVADNATTGGNKRGTNAIDLQTSRSANTQVASGSGSFTAGIRNTASNSQSVAIGISNTSSGTASVSLGNSNAAAGTSSFCAGNGNSSTVATTVSMGNGNVASGVSAISMGQTNTAGGPNSIAYGYAANTFNQNGRKAWSSSLIQVSGDSQKSNFNLKASTTNATATRPTSDWINTTTPTNTNQVYLQNNNAFRFKGSIIGKKSGSTDIGAWDIEGTIVRGANAASTVLVTSSVTAVTNLATWGTPTLAADTSIGCLNISVIGLAATNIRWTVHVETVEIIYA